MVDKKPVQARSQEDQSCERQRSQLQVQSPDPWCGNYCWGSEQVTRKARIMDVVYNATKRASENQDLG